MENTSMGMETMEWYNNFCLIGHTDVRGKGWHYMESMQGKEPNHYPGAIPYADVVRRLFSWKPREARTGNFVPCKLGNHDVLLPKIDKTSGEEVLDDNGQQIMSPYKIVEVRDKKAIVRSDPPYLELGHVTLRYRIHDYEKWLLQLLSNVLGDTLDIWSAILLRNGAQACVQAALPETVQDTKTGVEFVPYIHAYTSLDGSLATTYAAQSLLIVCDNTMLAANAQAERSGRQYREKHTAASLSRDIKDVQSALSIVSQQADNTIDFYRQLAAVKVSKPKWIEVMDVILPPVEETKDKEGKTTNARAFNSRSRTRELLNSTYFDDPMGAAEHVGTALGVLRAVNTYVTHYQTVRGTSRVQRNASKIVDGEFARGDMKTLAALAQVLDKPELVGKTN